MLTVETIGRIRREHFVKWQDDQADCPGPAGISEYGSQDAAVGGDVPRIRSGRPTAAKAGPVDNGSRLTTGSERDQGCSRATDADPHLRGTARARLRGWIRCRAALRQTVEQGTRALDGGGLCPAELRAGGSLPVRLEPRGRPAEWRDGDREGRPWSALSQPHAVRAGLSARDPGDGGRCPRPGLRAVQGRLRAPPLRQA